MKEAGTEAVEETEAEEEVEREAGEETENGAAINARREAGSEAVGKTRANAREEAVEEIRNEAGGSQGIWRGPCSGSASGRGREAGNYQTFLQIFLLPANASDAAAFFFSFSSYSSSTNDDVNMSSHILVSL